MTLPTVSPTPLLPNGGSPVTTEQDGRHPSMQEQRQFWNDWNTKHRLQTTRLPDVNSRQAQAVLDHVARQSSQDLDILEIGCGSGWLCERLLPFGSVTGTDLSDRIIEAAQARVPAARFLAGDFLSLELRESTFDVVVSLEVLSHVIDQHAFMHKAARLLRPGGTLLLATQNRFSLERWTQVPAQGEGQVRKWVDARQLRALVDPYLDILELRSFVPVGDRGVLRLINSPRLTGLLSLVVSPEHWISWKERRLLGHTLFVVARRPAARV